MNKLKQEINLPNLHSFLSHSTQNSTQISLVYTFTDIKINLKQ